MRPLKALAAPAAMMLVATFDGGWLWGWDGQFGSLYGVISRGNRTPNTSIHFSP